MREKLEHRVTKLYSPAVPSSLPNICLFLFLFPLSAGDIYCGTACSSVFLGFALEQQLSMEPSVIPATKAGNRDLLHLADMLIAQPSL